MKFLNYPDLTNVSNQLDGLDLGDRVFLTKIETYSLKQTHEDKKLYRQLITSIQDSLPSKSKKLDFTSIDSLVTTYASPPPETVVSVTQGYTTTSSIPASLSDEPPALEQTNSPNQISNSNLETKEANDADSTSINENTSNNILKNGKNSHQNNFLHLPPIPTPIGDLRFLSTQKLLCTLIMTLNSSYPDYDFSSLDPNSFEPVVHGSAMIHSINETVLLPADNIKPGIKRSTWAAIDEAVQIRDCIVFSYLSDPDNPVFSLGKLWSCNYFFFNRELRRVLLFSCAAKSKLMTPLLGSRLSRWDEIGGFDLGGTNTSSIAPRRRNSTSRRSVSSLNGLSRHENVSHDDFDIYNYDQNNQGEDKDCDDDYDDDDQHVIASDDDDDYNRPQFTTYNETTHDAQRDVLSDQLEDTPETYTNLSMDSFTDEMAEYGDDSSSINHKHRKRSQIDSLDPSLYTQDIFRYDNDMIDWESLSSPIVSLPANVLYSPFHAPKAPNESSLSLPSINLLGNDNEANTNLTAVNTLSASSFNVDLRSLSNNGNSHHVPVLRTILSENEAIPPSTLPFEDSPCYDQVIGDSK